MHTAWTPELVDALAEPFARELHQSKGKKGTFVSVHHYVRRLNDLVGPQGWSMEAPTTYHAGEKLGICVGITILGVTKWNVGDEMEDHGEPEEDGVVRDYGSSSTNSWAQAFKRCMAYGFGCGLYLYDKKYTQALLSDRPAPQQSDAPTHSQVQLIEKVLRSHVFTDAEREATKKSLAKHNTKTKAAELIDRLTKEVAKRKLAEKEQVA